MRKGLFLFSVVYLLSVSISVSLAGISDLVDPSDKNSKIKSEGDSQFKTDSTEVNEQTKPFNPESTELGNFSSSSNTSSNEGELPAAESAGNSSTPTKDYYGNEEDSDESSQSMISFNFLYYLLQKFKLSNSLGY